MKYFSMFSGIGGQVDFVRGAFNSKGGRSFLAFPSTAGKPGQLISRIVPQLAAGTPVSTPRNDIEYVVTEYGIANLRYKTMRERALALIEIAHPDFRADLSLGSLRHPAASAAYDTVQEKRPRVFGPRDNA